MQNNFYLFKNLIYTETESTYNSKLEQTRLQNKGDECRNETIDLQNSLLIESNKP